jgi:tetratricopeptide (TPR) repeat protein
MYAWEKMGSGSGQQQQGDATEAKGFVRTTNAVEDSDDDDEEQEDNDNQEPSSKRQRSAPEDANNASSSNDPVLAVLQEATRTVPTKDMYLQVIRFLRSYLEQLETGNGGGDNDSKEEQENEEQEDNSERLEVVRSFLEGILKDTTTLEFYDSDLLSAHVDYLESGEKVEDAIHLLEAFLQSNPATADKSQLPAKLWTDWARLVSFSQSVVAGISILEKALKQIPMAESDHMIVLLELLGAKLLANIDEKVTGDCGDIFQRIILLAPGFVEMEDIEEPSFGIDNVSSACLQYLRHKMNTDGVAGARVVYNAVLFQSGVGKSMGANGDESIKAFIDEAIEAEMNDKSNAAAKNRLRRLYDLAVETFSHTSFADEYRRRRNEVVIYG